MKNVTNDKMSIEQTIESLKLELKNLQTQKKELTKKEKAPKKGDLVRFKNKAGETIEGLGRLYYCVSIDNKLHYKQLDSVEVIQKND